MTRTALGLGRRLAERAFSRPRARRRATINAAGAEAGLEPRQLLATFVVNSLLDVGPRTLRQAINDANATPNAIGVPDQIIFSIPGGGGTISLFDPLPDLTEAVRIDAGGQPVIVDGPGFGNGLFFGEDTDGSAVRNLTILDFDSGIVLAGSDNTTIVGNRLLSNNFEGLRIEFGSDFNTIGGTTPAERNRISGNGLPTITGTPAVVVAGSNNVVRGNWVGLDAAGNAAQRNGAGILVTGSSNRIGGELPGEGNVVSGNVEYGISLSPAPDAGPVFESTNTDALPIPDDGTPLEVPIVVPTPGTIEQLGVSLDLGQANAQELRISLIRVNPDGTETEVVLFDPARFFGAPLTFGFVNTTFRDGANLDFSEITDANVGNGTFRPAESLSVFDDTELADEQPDGTFSTTYRLRIVDTVPGNADPADFGLFSFVLRPSISTGFNVVQGNRIGTSADGSRAIANEGPGLEIAGGDFNTVGGTTVAARNLISGNDSDGILLDGTLNRASGNRIIGNYIGTDAAGLRAIPNILSGINAIGDVVDSTIGGSTADERNVISGNLGFGVVLGGEENILSGNYIGTNATGRGGLGNLGDGLVLRGYANTIGGDTPAEGNVISGNRGNGVSSPGEPFPSFSRNFRSSDVPQDISFFLPPTVSFLDVRGPTEILDVNVSLTVTHDFVADLIVTLISPSGTRVELVNQEGGAGLRNFTRTTFDDEASIAITAANPPFTGTFRPEEPLSAFDGELATGRWLIEIVDVDPADDGTLDAWSLNFTFGEPEPVLEPVPVTFAAPDTPKPINSDEDGGGDPSDPANVTLTTITVPDNRFGFVESLTVGVTITHPFISDLGLTLITPNGIRIPLMIREGVDGENLDVIFDDRAPQSIVGADPGFGNPLLGRFRPESPLRVYQGFPVAGDYTLEIVDLSPNSPGPINDPPTLDGFTLIINTLATQNVIQYNLIGVDSTGNARIANLGDGLQFNSYGGATVADNVISGNAQRGIFLTGALAGVATGSTFVRNRIGVSLDGSRNIPNTLEGIRSENAGGNIIGTPGNGNIIAGNSGDGIALFGALANQAGNVIQGNQIGTALFPNGGNGIVVDQQSRNLIGGTGAGEGNVITGNVRAGIVLLGRGALGSGNQILSNRIFGNGGLPIDQDENGSTPADQARLPVINVADVDPVAQTVTFAGTVVGSIGDTFLLQFFANPAAFELLFGEAEFFLGQQTVTIAPGSVDLDPATPGITVAFEAVIANPQGFGPFFSATATRTVSATPGVQPNTTEFALLFPRSDVAVEIPDTLPPQALLAPIVFPVLVTNNGPGTALDLRVRITLPIEMQLLSISGSVPLQFPIPGPDGSTVLTPTLPTSLPVDELGRFYLDVALGNLPVGQTATLQVTMEAKLGVGASGIFRPEVELLSVFSPDFQPQNNFDIGLVPVQALADVQLSLLNLSNAAPTVGDSISYTLRAFNAGPNKAASAFIVHELPVGAEVVSVNPSSPDLVISVTNGTLLVLKPLLGVSESMSVDVRIRLTSNVSQTLSAYAVFNDRDLNVGGGDPVTNNNRVEVPIRIAPATGSVSFTQVGLTVNENVAGGTATIAVQRLGGTVGVTFVTVTVVGSTATLGRDFPNPGPFVLRFDPGVALQVLSFPITNDRSSEATETITLQISQVSNGVGLGRDTTLLLTIIDDETAGVPIPPKPDEVVVTPPPATNTNPNPNRNNRGQGATNGRQDQGSNRRLNNNRGQGQRLGGNFRNRKLNGRGARLGGQGTGFRTRN